MNIAYEIKKVDFDKKRAYPLEHDEQKTFFSYLLTAYPHVYQHTFAIPNGAHKTYNGRRKFQKEGLKAGVPDLFVALPMNGYSGLFIEMKRVNGNNPGPQQRTWLNRLSDAGYKCVVCKGCDMAIEAVKEYLDIEKK